MVDALLVVADKTALTSGDTALSGFLVDLGFVVTAASDEDTEITTGYDVVVISESCNSGTLGTKYKDSTIPTVNCENASWDDHNYVNSAPLTSNADNDYDIILDTHELAGGLKGSGVSAYSSLTDLKYMTDANIAASAIKVATVGGQPTWWSMFAFESGASVYNSDTTNSRRVCLSMFDTGTPSLSTNGKWLFEAAVRWASGLDVGVGFNANAERILFVADDEGLGADDEAMADRIRGTLGLRVTVFSDGEVVLGDATGFDAVMVSKTVTSTNIQDKFKTFSGGFWTFEDNLQAISIATNPMMAFIDLTDPVDTAWHAVTTQWYINPSAPTELRAGLSGLTTIYSSSQESTYAPVAGDNNGALPGTATRIGEFNSNGDGRWSYYIYNPGDTLADATTAAGRRVFFGIYDNAGATTFEFLTADGLALFDASVNWAASVVTVFDVVKVENESISVSEVTDPVVATALVKVENESISVNESDINVVTIVGYVQLTGNAGSFISSPDSAGLSVTGDLELIACFEIDSVITNDHSIIDKFVTDTGYRMIALDDGDMQFAWGDGATFIPKNSTATGYVVDGTPVWLRMTLDVSTGDWVMYTSDDPVDTDPGSVTWTQQLSGSHGATSIADGATTAYLGTRSSGEVWAGKFYQARISDGGVVVANPNFTNGDQTSDGGLTFVDSHSNVWTLQGDASWVGPPLGNALLRVHNDTLNIGFDFETLVRVINESASVSELESTLRALLRLVIEENQATEAAQRILGLIRTTNESISSSETVSRLRGLVRTRNETSSLTESIEFYRALIRSVEESVSLLETDTNLRGLLRLHLETLTTTEAVTPVRYLLRAINEGLSLTEASLALRGLIRAVDETLALTDTDDYLRGRLQLVSESLSITETDTLVRALVRMMNETISLPETDLSIRGLFRLVSESLSLADDHLRYRGLFKVQDETLTTTETDLALRGLLQLVSDSLSLTDTDLHLRGLVRAVSETLTTTETPLTLRDLIRAVSETLNLTDTDLRVRSLVRTQLDTLALSETNTAYRALVRAISESLSLTDDHLALLARDLLRIVNETLNIGTLQGNLLQIVDETISASEADAHVRGLLRQIAESITTTEALLTFRALLRSVVESLSLPELVLSPRTLTRIQTETIAVSELTLAVRALVRTISEALNVDETAAVYLGLVRLIQETSVLTETDSHTRGLLRAISESLSLSELDLVLRGILRMESESIVIPETDLIFRALFRVVDEAVSLTETTATLRALTRLHADPLTVVESVVRTRALIRTFSESTTVAEQVDVLRGLVRVYEETLNLTEDDLHVLATVAQDLLRVVDEAMQATEEDALYRGRLRTHSESLALTELVLALRLLTRIQTETTTTEEAVTRYRDLVRQTSESSEVAESVAWLRGIFRLVDESIEVSELPLGARALARLISEGVEATEQATKLRELLRLIAESELMADSQDRSRTLVRAIQEALFMAETPVRIRSLLRQISDLLSIPEGPVSIRGRIRIVMNTLSLTYTAARLRGRIAKVNEQAQLADTAIRQRGRVRTQVETTEPQEAHLRVRGIVRVWDDILSLVESLASPVPRFRFRYPVISRMKRTSAPTGENRTSVASSRPADTASVAENQQSISTDMNPTTVGSTVEGEVDDG